MVETQLNRKVDMANNVPLNLKHADKNHYFKFFFSFIKQDNTESSP